MKEIIDNQRDTIRAKNSELENKQTDLEAVSALIYFAVFFYETQMIILLDYAIKLGKHKFKEFLVEML